MPVRQYLIAAHPTQQAIIDEVAGTGIDQLSLRQIAARIGLKPASPQKVKWHLGQLVKYGFLDVVGGKYRVGQLLTQGPASYDRKNY